MEKIFGCVFGGAYGDAIGKATEFLSPDQVRSMYNPSKKISFDDIVSDFHRDGWEKNDWTDDTDQMVLVMQTIRESQPSTCQNIFAKKLYNWIFHGFSELGDTSGVGIGAPIGWCINSKNFREMPFSIAEEIWRNSDGYMYEDGAIMRCAVAGCFDKPKNEIFNYTKRICQTTHYDPRCIASCIFIVSCVYEFVRGNTNVEDVVKNGEIDGIDFIESLDYIQGVEYDKCTYIKKFKKYIQRAKQLHYLSEIDFNKGHSRSNTKYPLYCAIYGLRMVGKGSSFVDIIQEIIRQGGDADTNACVAGSLMGSFLGFDNLPQEDIRSLKHFDWLRQQVSENILV